MNAVIAPVAFIVVIAAVIGSLWHFVLQPWLQERMAQPTSKHRPRHRASARTRVRWAARWLRWIGPRMWLRIERRREYQAAKARVLLAVKSGQPKDELDLPESRFRAQVARDHTDSWSAADLKELGKDRPFRPDPVAKLAEISRIPAWRPIPAPALNAPWDRNLVIPARALAPVSSAEHTITNGAEFAGWVRALLACPVDQVASILERQNEALGAS